MKTVLKSVEPATLSFARAMLEEAGIPAFEFDTHASVVEGSIGALIPRRLAVADDDYEAAKQVLTEAGVDPFKG